MKKLNVAFACICTELGDQGRFRTTTIKSLKKLCVEEQVKKVKGLFLNNLSNTKAIIKYCIQQGFSAYRLSSSLLPCATYISEYWDWENDNDVIALTSQINMLITVSGIQASFHPNQFVSLTNFNKPEVFEKVASPVLEYHNTLCNMLNVSTILLHCGGKHNDIDKAMDNFEYNFNRLPKSIRNRIKLENDRIYNIEETLTLANRINVPTVIDFHHFRVNPTDKPIEYYMDDIRATWRDNEVMKIHLSSGKTSDTDNAHADYIKQSDYDWCRSIVGDDVIIMVEAKKKEQAVLALNL